MIKLSFLITSTTDWHKTKATARSIEEITENPKAEKAERWT